MGRTSTDVDAIYEETLKREGLRMTLSRSSHYSLKRLAVLGASAIAISAGTANAQQVETIPDASDQVDDTPRLATIIVTGSNVRTSTFNSRVPVDVVGRTKIEAANANQLIDVLADIPANTGSLFAEEAGLTAGTGQFNIRGLGLASTLTLVNGRRGGVAPVADSSGADFTDINQFPLSMVERVEVLKDGASAVYGSEAVSGVANIITRKGFEGFELSGAYEDASNEAYSLSVAAGKRFDDATFNFYATYYHQSRNNRGDFDWLVDRIHGGDTIGRSRLLSASGSPGTYFPATFNTDGDPIGLSGGAGFADPDCEAAGGIFPIRDDGTTNTSFCRHSFFNQQSVISEQNRIQAFVESEIPISERVTYYNEASYSRNVMRDDNGPLPTNNGLIAANGAGRIFIPADHPFNFFIEDPTDSNALVYIDPSVWDNAIHTAVPLSASMRPLGNDFNATGVKDQDQRREFNYGRLLNGVEIDVTDTWQVNASHMVAWSNLTNSIPLTYIMDTYNQLVLDGEWNPFGTRIADPNLISPKDGVSIAGSSDAVRDQFLTTASRDIRTVQNVVDLIATGELGDFGTGPIGVAIGAQYRNLELTDTPDALVASGQAARNSLSFPVDGDQTVWAGFAEAVFPLGDRAEVQFAVRHEDYGDFGSSTDPKVAAEFNATDWLTLRGSWGTAFQAPTIRQTAEQTNFEFIDDSAFQGAGGATCGAGGPSQGVLVRTRGNDDLTAQSSRSFTIGAIMNFFDAVDVSADYWNFEYDDLIAPGLNGQTIVDNDCNDDGIPNDPRVLRDGSGQLTEVLTSFENVGKVETDGIDFSLAYQLPTSSLGDVSVRTDVAYVRKFDVFGSSGGAFDGAGSRNATNNFNTLPKWRGNASINWAKDVHSANVTIRYIDGYDNDQSNNAPIDSFTTVDLQYGIDLSDFTGSASSRILLGAENVFDEDPPALVRFDSTGQLISGTIADIDRPGYDPRAGHSFRGRVLYARFVQEF